MPEYQPVLDIIQSFGMVGVLAYLWLQERKEANQWQERYIGMMERLCDRSFREP